MLVLSGFMMLFQHQQDKLDNSGKEIFIVNIFQQRSTFIKANNFSNVLILNLNKILY